MQQLVSGCVSWTPPAPGNVAALATATDVSGLVANDSRSLQVADCNDEQKPVVTLFSPLQDSLLNELTPLVVSIDDNTPEALTWTVSIRAGQDGQPEVLSEGTGLVDQSEVAMIDPTRLSKVNTGSVFSAATACRPAGLSFGSMSVAGSSPAGSSLRSRIRPCRWPGFH